MAICADDIEQIRTIIYDSADRTEKQINALKDEIVEDIKVLSQKLDTVIKDQNIISERVTKLEVCNSIIEESRKEQGRRIGECEKKLAILSGQDKGIEKGSNWVRWIIPVLLSVLSVAITLIVTLRR